jgi:hypothetical protein
MYTVLLPPDVNPIAVDKYIISYLKEDTETPSTGNIYIATIINSAVNQG